MQTYVLRRLLIALPSLVLASLIVFTLPRLIPGDVVQLMLEEKAYGKDLDDLRSKLGLDRPLHAQYVDWLGSVVRGHLGESLWTRRPVLEELGRRLPITLTLGLFATLVAAAIGTPIGVLAAVRQDGILDFFARSAAILGLSVPGFVLAILVTLLPAIWWGWTPLVRFVELSHDPVAHLLQFVVPAAILGIEPADRLDCGALDDLVPAALLIPFSHHPQVALLPHVKPALFGGRTEFVLALMLGLHRHFLRVGSGAFARRGVGGQSPLLMGGYYVRPRNTSSRC